MESFLDFVLEWCSHLVGWRTWLCVIGALIAAWVLSAWGLRLADGPGPYVVAGVLGLVVGLCWDARET